MSEMMDCAQVRVCLGVYVLGAIDPTERAMVDAHLATCRDCRDELAGLAGIPALLARISTEEVLKIDEGKQDRPAETVSGEAPSEELLGSVLDLAAARRRRRTLRNSLLTAAAAVIIAAGAFGGAHLLASHSSSPSAAAGGDPHSWGGATGAWETAQGANASGEGGWVAYRPMRWGLLLDTRVVGIPVGTTCQLYVVTRDGKRHLAGQWSTDSYENAVWYPGSAAVPAAQVTAFEVTTGRTPPVVIPAH
jgi:hypothetical protein